jgi:hypothetical protein
MQLSQEELAEIMFNRTLVKQKKLVFQSLKPIKDLNN